MGHASMQAATQDWPERLSPSVGEGGVGRPHLVWEGGGAGSSKFPLGVLRAGALGADFRTYTAAEVPFPRSRLRAATQPLRRSSCLPCSLAEVLDPPPRRRANAGVSGEQMLDVTGSEDDSGTRGGGYGTVARLHIASCGDLAASRNNRRRSHGDHRRTNIAH